MIAKLLEANSRYLALVILSIIVVGYTSLNGMARKEDPAITPFFAKVQIVFPGASPERVETLITKPMVDALREEPDVKEVDGTSASGVSLIFMEIDYRLPKDRLAQIWSELRDKIDEVAAALPPGALPPDFDDELWTEFVKIIAISGADGRTLPPAQLRRQALQFADAARGVFAPDYILDTTMKMQAALRDQPAAQTVLVTSFVKKLSEAGLPPERAAQAEKIVAEKIFPAVDRQRTLVQALRAKAVHDAGCWRLPDGEAFYANAAEAATTTKLSGDEIHRIGLDQVAQISGRIDAILKGEGMSQGSVGERLVALNKRPDQLYPNTDPGREALLAQLNRQIIAMSKRLPEAFSPNTLPKAPVEVRRVPVTIQAGAPGGYYQNASLDGSRPAIYYINLRDTFDRPKFGLATLTHHEAVPGHHLQVSVALESDAIPMIRRRGGYSGYSEGWALYSEQLADEMGLYEGDPLGQVGYLQSLLFRATRLVVDSGMHAKRWSREKATDFLIATTGIARGRSQGEIDRYTVWPGQACSYKIGHTVWNDLREEVKKKQGAAFDIKQFHEVLTLGAMPLDILKQTVRRRSGIAS